MSAFLLSIADQISSSTALQIFSASTSLLLIALLGLVWARAVHWTFLDSMPLSRVEWEHPVLPSLRRIGLQAAAFLCVFIAVGATQQRLTDEPFQIIRQFGPVLILAAIGIAAELHTSIRVHIYGLALSLGTAIGLSIASLATLATLSVAGIASSLFLSGAVVLLLSVQMLHRDTTKHWPIPAHALLILAAILWAYFHTVM